MAENGKPRLTLVRLVKLAASDIIAGHMRWSVGLRDILKNLYAHAMLASNIRGNLPASAVVLGRVYVFGTRRILIGENVLFQPHLHLETRETGRIEIGRDGDEFAGAWRCWAG